MDEIRKGVWQHYSGSREIVEGTAIEESTGDVMVLYRKEEGGDLIVQPLSRFLGVVPEQKFAKRFRFIGE